MPPLIERIARKQPGWDCERGPCSSKGCPGYGKLPRGRQHGIHGEEWHYAVIANDRRTALDLAVCTNIYPATVPTPVRRCYQCGRPTQDVVFSEDVYPPAGLCGCREAMDYLRHGTNMALHVAFPTTIDDLMGDSQSCDYVGRCYGDRSTALGARDFFRAHGDPRGFKQPESFWLALEAALSSRAARLGPPIESATCPTCNGKGCVP